MSQEEQRIKVNGNVIKKWLANKGQKSHDCGRFIMIDSKNKEWLSTFLEVIKKQFPNNISYINDWSNDWFIVIEK